MANERRDGADKAMKDKVRSLTGIEAPEFKDLTKEELEMLHQMRQILALDMLEYRNADIERILGLKKDQLYGLRGNYPVLWGMAENDFLRRMRLHLDAVNDSIAELVSDGEIEMLWRLRHVAQGGKRSIRVPGHPSIKLTTIPGEMSPTLIVSAAQAFLKHSEILNQRFMTMMGVEEAKDKGLKVLDDDFARHVKAAQESEGERKVVKKYKDRKARESAKSYANATADKSDKDLLPIQ